MARGHWGQTWDSAAKGQVLSGGVNLHERRATARKIFERYAAETIRFNKIAERLKNMNIDLARAKPSSSSGFVSNMQLNPVHIGLPA